MKIELLDYYGDEAMGFEIKISREDAQRITEEDFNALMDGALADVSNDSTVPERWAVVQVIVNGVLAAQANEPAAERAVNGETVE